MSKTTKIILAVVSLFLVACVCLSVICVGAAGALVFYQNKQSTQPENIPAPTLSYETPAPTQVEQLPQATETSQAGQATDTPEASQASPTPFAASTPDASAQETLKTLEGNIVPENNPVLLAEEFKGKTNIAATVAPPAQPYKVGDKKKFWVSNQDNDENRQVDATLRYVNDVVYFWIEDSVQYNSGDLRRLADTFATQIYPTDRKFFGSEWSPGIDGETRLYVLYTPNVGKNIAGYFSSADEIPPAASMYSNAHEMFVLSSDNINLGEEYTYGTMAHEFQHMIHYATDRNEDTWVNEGFSVLAEMLNKYDIGGFDRLFAQNPDMQLTYWEPAPNSDPNYGAAFLYLAYFLGRFGDKATQAVVANPDNGMDSIDEVLKSLKIQDPQSGAQLTADDVFADWAVANYLDDQNVAGGRYYYSQYPQAPKVSPTETYNSCPIASQARSVHQYGAQYLDITCKGSYTLDFQGSAEVPLLPADPASGSYAFWSNQGDESDMTLTQAFDLSQVSGAVTLKYKTWYDVEENYDFVYLSASEDGKTWKTLKTPSGTDKNITGANLGWGYTGKSGKWLDEQVDLSAYAGKKIQLRFDYVTDAAINGRGMMIDDISIPEIKYQSDFEKDNGGWEGKGFVRVANKLPQSFRVSLIKIGAQTTVEPLALDASQHGSVKLDLGNGVDEVVVVVSGVTRFTNELANFNISVR